MASKGINKVILIGYLGQDPDIRYMPNGGAVGQHCAGHLRNLAGQTDRGDAGTNRMAPRGAVRQTGGSSQ